MGCFDCDNTKYAYEACAKTAKANVTGVICDGEKMRNWVDRYPVVCLQAVGEFYKADALAALKQSYRNQLAIIILTVLGGLVGSIITYTIWKRLTQSRRERAKANRIRSQQWPNFFDVAPWRTTPEKHKGEQATSQKGQKLNRLKLFFISFFALFTKAKSYPCTGHDPTYNQYFVNTNHTIFGVVHGWFSNCHDVTTCTPSCSTDCFGAGGVGGTSCSTSCTEICTTTTYSDRAPEAYVNDTLPAVQACGFELQDQVEGDVSVRVANSGIEKNWWVKINVNGFNVTRINVTDEQIWCLWEIGNNSK